MSQRHPHINFLLTPPTQLEQAKIDELVVALMHLRMSWEDGDVSEIQRKMLRIQHARILSSNSLRLGQQIQYWEKANQCLYQAILSERALDWSFISELNQTLCPGSHLRNGTIFSGPEAYMGVLEMQACLSYFQQHLLATLESQGPLIAASIVRYWIVSLHPFSNGNGRCANLCADYFLLKNGWPPLSFAGPLEGFVAYHPQGQQRTLATGLIATLQGVKNSLLS